MKKMMQLLFLKLLEHYQLELHLILMVLGLAQQMQKLQTKLIILQLQQLLAVKL
jgi:hypothetical protein